MKPRLLLVTVSLLALAVCLAACGGGGGSSPSTRPLTTSPAATTATPKPAKRESAAETAAQRRAAGRAAAFVLPKSDNSVPTFGSEAGAGERAQAEATLRSYLQARSAEDWASACRLLAKSVRQGYEQLGASSSKAKAGGCAPVLASLSKGADLTDPLTGHLLSLRVHGANAFALFYGPGHQQYMVPMNLEGGQWRPTQAAPIAYPPGAGAP
jgi:hypothetical protein